MSEKRYYPIDLSETEKKEALSPTEILLRKGNTEAKICPEKGGLVTSFKVDNTEIFHINQDSFDNLSDKKPKMGIPALIPNAGPGFRQHGFLREESLVLENESKNSAKLSFKKRNIKNEEIREQVEENYPYDFNFEIETTVDEGRLKYDIFAKNEGEKEMPFAPGLHPYFSVKREDFKNIETNMGFNLEGKEDEIESNPIILDRPDEDAWFTIPGKGRVTIKSSDEFKVFLVWSQKGADFICVEPWVGGIKALDKPNERINIPPKKSKKLSVEFLFEKEV